MTSAPALRAKTFPSVRKTLASLAFLALGWAASAEERAVRFVNIGVREGLANASVSSIVQDEAGFIWVGTQGGLHRWDGMSFRLYENEPFDDASLPHNLIQTMYMDPDGFTLWLGTYGGLVRFDTKTGRFSSWVHEPGNPRSLSNDVVVAIARDASGSLWAGTLNGLNRMDGEGFVRYLPEADAPATGSGTPGDARIRGLGSPVIRALHLDSRGRFWIGTSGAGLYRHEPSSDRFERYGAEPDSPLALPSAYVMDIDEDADGNLWLGLWFYGIARLDAGLSRVDGYKLADERVYFVNASVPGLIRAGTWGGGLFELSLPSGSVRRFTKSADRSWSLPHDTIYSMLVDASGETWVGTNGGGLSHMLKDAESFSLLEHDPSDPGSIASGKVNAILQDSRGRLWVGSYNGGLSRLDPGRAGFQRFLHDKKRPGSLPNDIVTKVYEASDSTIWILTNAGMARYDESSSTFISAFPGLNDPEGIASAVLYDMLEEPGTGNFWIATYTKGLAYWDRAENAISVRSAEPGKEGALGDNLVYALAYDSHGNLWLATNGGLYRLKPDGDFAAYRPVADDRTSLPSRIVRNLYVCPDGTVWLATNGGGVARYEEASDSFRYWTKRDGLPSNLALAVLQGPDGRLWASTVTGLAYYEPAADRWRSFVGPSDLRYSEFTIGSAAGMDGTLYFGAVNAIYAIDSRMVSSRSFLPPVRLTGVSVDNKPLESAGSPWTLEEIRLPWNIGSVSLTFAALDYRDPSRNQYAYKLEGLDAGWTFSGARAYAAYTNLVPGKSYTFRVKASNNESLWNEEGTSLRIRLDPSPWFSWWAMLAYALLAGALIWLYVALRSRSLLAGKVDELSRLKSELEDANVRLQNLASHDGLTGLWNRRALNVELARRFQIAYGLGEELSVLMVDIDCFKAYNDRYGHQMGDETLMAVAEAIASALDRPQDSASRYGGEEFAVILPGTGIRGAAMVAERIRSSVERLAIEHGACSTGAVVTASVGAASMKPEHGSTPGQLIDAADAALYKAKDAGRNRVATYQELD